MSDTQCLDFFDCGIFFDARKCPSVLSWSIVDRSSAHFFPLPLSSASPASRSFLLCATSQLYTRANATSSVY